MTAVAMDEIPSTGDRLQVAGPAGSTLVAGFLHVRDRIWHSLVVENDRPGPGGLIALLFSNEGAGGEAWPGSAPLQSVSFEEQPGGRRVALLVGMAGRSHWSASIEESPSDGSLIFDYACRASQRPEFLGSTYRLPQGVDLEAAEGGLILRRGEARLLLTAEAAGEFPPPRIERRDDLLVLSAALSAQKTIRWKYRLRLA